MNYMKLIGAYGNLSYGDEDAKELAQGMGVKVDVSKIEGADEKTITTIKEIAIEIHLL